MVNLICTKCSREMTCVTTGRKVIYPGNKVVSTNDWQCTNCQLTISYSNQAKPMVWDGSIGTLSDQAQFIKTQGRKTIFPLVVIERPSAKILSTSKNQLHHILPYHIEQSYLQSKNQFPSKLLADHFSDEEIVSLLDHPKFGKFSEEFQQMLWDQANLIFANELLKSGSS